MKRIINNATWCYLLHLTGARADSEPIEGSITATIGIAVTGIALTIICVCCLRRCFNQDKESPPPYRKMHEPNINKKTGTATLKHPESIALTESGSASSEPNSKDDPPTTRFLTTYGTAIPISIETTSLTGGSSPPPPYTSLYP